MRESRCKSAEHGPERLLAVLAVLTFDCGRRLFTHRKCIVARADGGRIVIIMQRIDLLLFAAAAAAGRARLQLTGDY